MSQRRQRPIQLKELSCKYEQNEIVRWTFSLSLSGVQLFINAFRGGFFLNCPESKKACLHAPTRVFEREGWYMWGICFREEKDRDKERGSRCSDLFLIEMFTSDVFQQAIRMATAVFFQKSAMLPQHWRWDGSCRKYKIGKKNGEQS